MRRLASATGLVVALSGPAYAATWDAGAAPDLNWSSADNWDLNLVPGTGDDAVFNHVAGTSGATLTNVVDQAFTINTLRYGFRGSNDVVSFSHTTEIGAGLTLRLNDDLRIGDGNDGTNTASINVTIRGADQASKLVVGNGTTNSVALFINNDDTISFDNTVTGRVSLSGLNAFAFDGGSFGVADGQRGMNVVVDLATNNDLRGTTFTFGNALGNGGSRPGLLTLGASNVVQFDTLYVGRQKFNGTATMRFATGLASADLVVRSRSGTGRTELRVAYNDADGTGVSTMGVLDLSGGRVDMLLSNLIVARKLGGGAGDAFGTFTFSNGVVDATSIVLGQTTANATNGTDALARLNVNGGTLTAGSITLADQFHAGTARGRVGAIVNFTAGALRANTVTQGQGTSVVNWTGGTLTVGSYGLDLTQNGASTVFSPGGGDATGTSGVSGSYALTSGSWLIDVAGGGASDSVAVSGLLDLSGTSDALSVNLLGGDATGNVFVIATYGSLNGVFESVNLSELPAGTTIDYAYNGNSIAVLVPEPGALGLIGLAGAALVGRRRRR